MNKLKLRPLEDETPVKVTVDLPAATHRNLLAYAQAHAAQTGGKAAEPARLVVPMLDQFMASDRAFVRGRKGREG
ncbi:hypothetical protein J2X45_000940 [Caulobacter sp. BE264]|jgi:hypothetical protein|uniref:DUF2274 domain-containing protein n=1 Tax=Caulobacter vibrioides TaxID=155892 RepID=A0A290MJ69_CAUVI|nr:MULTISPECIES: DUF2274 domain-containing protein [Caulobacter]ATC32103.1 DUF2274 domain-containing protein [Caulobacter vibrioides]MDR7229877.1 hypothetical protein [Caulobacter sp. BE264]